MESIKTNKKESSIGLKEFMNQGVVNKTLFWTTVVSLGASAVVYPLRLGTSILTLITWYKMKNIRAKDENKSLLWMFAIVSYGLTVFIPSFLFATGVFMILTFLPSKIWDIFKKY
ncbi:MAG: hypothetical protein ACOCV1_08670 [Bacillota bacterium]